MMESTRRITTLRQLEILVQLMRKYPDVALSRLRSKEARATSARIWAEVAEALNTERPVRTSKEWSKVWNDLKFKVRAKLMAITAIENGTGGGNKNAVSLSTVEESVAQIMGHHVGTLQNVAQNNFANNIEIVVEEGTDVHEHESSPILLYIDSPAEIKAPSPVPSTSGQAPSTPPGAGGPRRLMRGKEQRRVDPISREYTIRRPMRSSRRVLEDLKSMVLHIERLRAETALENAKTRRIVVTTFAESAKLIAESIDRFGQRHCQQE